MNTILLNPAMPEHSYTPVLLLENHKFRLFEYSESNMSRKVDFFFHRHIRLPAGVILCSLLSLLGDMLVNLLVILALLPAFFVIFGSFVLISLLLGVKRQKLAEYVGTLWKHVHIQP